MAEPREQLTVADKAHIAGLYRGGNLSLNDIAEMYNRRKSTIKRVVDLFMEDDQCARRKGSGRPRKMNDGDLRQVVLAVKRERYITCSRIKRELRLEVSARTVNRRLTETKEIYSAWTQAKPWISKDNRVRRVQWCKDHLEWTLEDWKSVLWSDESPFELRNGMRKRVWKLSEEAFHVTHYTATVKHEVKINVWGCFSYDGVGTLYWVDGIMDSKQYCKILREAMVPASDDLFPEGEFIFQQDNDPKHTCNMTYDWLDGKGIDYMDWLAYSPDLNPIENLWAILKQRMVDRACKNQEELFLCIQEAWYSIPIDIIHDLVDSMKRRCQEVIEKKGYPTKY
jgi:transposase